MKEAVGVRKAAYLVGYGKPPVDHQFKSGNKEHLKRSLRKRKSEAALFRDLAGAPVRATCNGNAVYRSRIQLLVENFIAAAVRGNIKAAAAVLTLHSKAKEVGDLAPIVIVLSGADAEL